MLPGFDVGKAETTPGLPDDERLNAHWRLVTDSGRRQSRSTCSNARTSHRDDPGRGLVSPCVLPPLRWLSSSPVPQIPPMPIPKRAVWSWILYDLANTIFSMGVV